MIIRVADDPRRAEGWSFVLEALGIGHRLMNTAVGTAIVVDAAVARKASEALTESDREASERVDPEPAAPDAGPSTVGVAVAMALVAFYFVTTRGDLPWLAAGTAVAEPIVHGAWWRAITALTLHADLGHVAGNGAALIIFVSALGRWLGRGLALLLVLFTGFAGNLFNAYLHGSHHASIGASTAVFGALGLLGGLQFMRRYRWKARLDRRRWALAAIAACLGVLAMLGGGGVDLDALPIHHPNRIDVIAHALGLLVGLGTGLGVGRFLRRPPGSLVQAALVVSSLAVVGLSWWQAFR